eukprot:CAMPEP_0172645210 /NCGR_PEP_ID=MMETSP1068-20121228/239612_1 /TAXON_ID=35684 /ORGANISM="Pseudopedinella elastica, Strain CCMP716" /LENGTH=324 /DNA_ID=CAMNT_0013459439 /DNA_START=44 /DNA_END=1019 /DNA_ORIENTATION=+
MSRSRSRSKSPPAQIRRSRSDSPRRDGDDRGNGGDNAAHKSGESASLLVRNLPYNVNLEDIRHDFGKYGIVRDVYMPKDFNTGQPRGFAFVEFLDRRDAEFAREKMDGKRFQGRECAVMIAENKRKAPEDMDAGTGPGVALPRAEDMTATAATATVVTAIVATATVAGYASDASGALTFACAFLFSLRLTSLSRYLSHPFSSNISALASHCATRQALPVTLSWTRHRLYPLLVARATTAAVAAIATKNDHRPVGTAPTHRTGAAGTVVTAIVATATVAGATTAAVAAIATKNDHRPVGTAPTHRTGAAGGAQDRALARTAAEGK